MITTAYTIMHLHCNSILQMNSMDEIIDFLQHQLRDNSHFKDEGIFLKLRQNMKELQQMQLASPGPPPNTETPSIPFGYVEQGESCHSTPVDSVDKYPSSVVTINSMRLKKFLDLKSESPILTDQQKQLKKELKMTLEVSDA